MAADRRSIRSVCKLISKRVVSTGTTFLLNDSNEKSFDAKLEELWLSKQEAMTIFVDEIDKVREEIKLQLHEFIEYGKHDGILRILDEPLIESLIEMSEPEPNTEESLKTVLPSLDLTNIRESSRTSTRRSREIQDNSTGSISHREVSLSPDFVEVSDSSIEKSSFANQIVDDIFCQDRQAEALSIAQGNYSKTAETNISLNDSKEKLNKKMNETSELSSPSFYSVPSTEESNKSAGECKPWRKAKAIPVLPDGSVLKTPRVLENDDLKQQMRYSSHRLSTSSDEILSERFLNDEIRWNEGNPKVVQIDVASSFNSNKNIECISARSLEKKKKEA
ncbi:unnamed protein product [Auanema sp. JU1783]|nr:unnamed protein product [Auanema sp. JU1783]